MKPIGGRNTIIEIDEALLGKKHGLQPFGNNNKTMRIWVVGASERKSASKKYMRFQVVRVRTKTELRKFIKKNINPSSIVFTDGWLGY